MQSIPGVPTNSRHFKISRKPNNKNRQNLFTFLLSSADLTSILTNFLTKKDVKRKTQNSLGHPVWLIIVFQNILFNLTQFFDGFHFLICWHCNFNFAIFFWKIKKIILKILIWAKTCLGTLYHLWVFFVFLQNFCYFWRF